jgi:hypothetical protein
MKKYTLILAVFILSFVLLGFNAKSANAYDSGCTGAGPYSITTGQFCGTATLTSCAPGDLFSSLTGQPCSQLQTGSSFGNLGIGSRGSDVVAFQQMLKDNGFLFGNVDGIYGPITSAAAARYYQKYPSSTIPPEPCPLTANGNVSDNCYPNPTPCPAGTTATGMTGSVPPNYICQPITTSGSPTISRIDGPQTLGISQMGTWNITASDPSNKNLSYGVVWGDEPSQTYLQGSPMMNSIQQQSATFTHTYSKAGAYTPIFIVTNVSGQIAQTSLSVAVGNVNPVCEYANPPAGYHYEGGQPYPVCGGYLVRDISNTIAPIISGLNPSSGYVGTTVTITGSGFTTTGNTINFDIYTFPYVVAGNNGTTLTFTVPATIYYNNCPAGSLCPNMVRSTTGGNYNVSVTNTNGTSNAAIFTVYQSAYQLLQ